MSRRRTQRDQSIGNADGSKSTAGETWPCRFRAASQWPADHLCDWLHPTRRFSPGNNVAIYLSEGTYQELREPFDRLADGADPDLLDDLREMPFGSYGHLADRFGIHWFFKGEKL